MSCILSYTVRRQTDQKTLPDRFGAKPQTDKTSLSSKRTLRVTKSGTNGNQHRAKLARLPPDDIVAGCYSARRDRSSARGLWEFPSVHQQHWPSLNFIKVSVTLSLASFWDRPKLSMLSLTEFHKVFFGRPLCLIPSTSHVIQRLTQSLSS